MGGPVKFGVGDENAGATETERRDLDFDFVAKGDVEAAVYDLVESGLEGFNNRMRDVNEVSRWAQEGAFIVEQHPNHPQHLICELETSRGCAYRCSFCTEPLYGNPSFRSPPSVVGEVDALSDYGVKHFRLGRQADIPRLRRRRRSPQSRRPAAALQRNPRGRARPSRRSTSTT